MRLRDRYLDKVGSVWSMAISVRDVDVPILVVEIKDLVDAADTNVFTIVQVMMNRVGLAEGPTDRSGPTAHQLSIMDNDDDDKCVLFSVARFRMRLKLFPKKFRTLQE